MSLSDPIADMLTRVRNGVRISAKRVKVRNSKVCAGIAKVLKQEGYIDDYDIIDDGKQGLVIVSLKYGLNGEKVIRRIHRQSKPGRRVYCGVDSLPKVLDGLGIAIVSTSKGVLSDRVCRDQKVGGELLCTVY